MLCFIQIRTHISYLSHASRLRQEENGTELKWKSWNTQGWFRETELRLPSVTNIAHHSLHISAPSQHLSHKAHSDDNIFLYSLYPETLETRSLKWSLHKNRIRNGKEKENCCSSLIQVQLNEVLKLQTATSSSPCVRTATFRTFFIHTGKIHVEDLFVVLHFVCFWRMTHQWLNWLLNWCLTKT